MEDVEDAYIHGIMMLLGAGGFMIHRKIQKTGAALLEMNKLTVMFGGLRQAMNTQTQATSELNRRLDVTSETLCLSFTNMEKLVSHLEESLTNSSN